MCQVHHVLNLVWVANRRICASAKSHPTKIILEYFGRGGIIVVLLFLTQMITRRSILQLLCRTLQLLLQDVFRILLSPHLATFFHVLHDLRCLVLYHAWHVETKVASRTLAEGLWIIEK